MRQEGLWSTPAYWNGNVYIWGRGDTDVNAKLFKVNSGLLDTTPSSSRISRRRIRARHIYGVFQWRTERHRLGGADGPVHHPWHSSTVCVGCERPYECPVRERHQCRPGRRRGQPINLPFRWSRMAKCMLRRSKRSDVYGLFNDSPVAAAPSISPNGGTFAAPQNVTLSSATSSANIYYTLDGSVPTPASTALRGSDRDQYQHDDSGDRDCDRLRPECGKQCFLHLLRPDAVGEFHARRWDLFTQPRW